MNGSEKKMTFSTAWRDGKNLKDFLIFQKIVIILFFLLMENGLPLPLIRQLIWRYIVDKYGENLR